MWVYICKTLTISTCNIIKIGIALLRKIGSKKYIGIIKSKEETFQPGIYMDQEYEGICDTHNLCINDIKKV